MTVQRAVTESPNAETTSATKIYDDFHELPIDITGILETCQATVPVSTCKRKRKQSTYDGIIVKKRKHKCLFAGCNKTYIRSDHLTRHILTHSESAGFGKHFKCPEPNCPKSFNYSKSLRKHLQIHDPSKPLGCTVCGHAGLVCRFTLQKQLNNHMWMWHKDEWKRLKQTQLKPMVCCNKKFNTRQGYMRHLKKHLSECS